MNALVSERERRESYAKDAKKYKSKNYDFKKLGEITEFSLGIFSRLSRNFSAFRETETGIKTLREPSQ
jgi:hypothetical protein